MIALNILSAVAFICLIIGAVVAISDFKKRHTYENKN